MFTFSNIWTILTFDDFFKILVEKTSAIKKEARMKTIREMFDRIANKC